MSIGYIVVAHKLPWQLLRLTGALAASPSSRVLIHLDRRHRHDFDGVLAALRRFDHVHVTSDRAIRWGHISMVDTLLDCLDRLLRLYPDITHVKHLSGQDYPIKPIVEFEALLDENRDASLMTYYSLPSAVWSAGGERNGGLDRIRYAHIVFGRRFKRLPIRRGLRLEKFYGGSALWCLSRRHASHVLEQAPSFRKQFRWALSADELFFHTILLNSRFAELVIDNGMTFTSWAHAAASPKVLMEQDLPKMLASGCWFARKFDSDLHPAVLDRIDGLLAG